jgi:hypothetical protein
MSGFRALIAILSALSASSRLSALVPSLSLPGSMANLNAFRELDRFFGWHAFAKIELF